MSTNCTGTPALAECGDTVSISQQFSNYDASAWTIALFLSFNGTAATNVAGTGTGTNWSFVLPAATTSNLSAGNYFFAYYATSTSNNTRNTVATGAITFIPNLAATQTVSISQQQLDALNATILTLSASGNASCSFNGQSFTKRDLHQLMEMRRELEAQVFREQRAAANLRGVVDSGNIAPRFVPDACGPYPYYWGIGGGN